MTKTYLDEMATRQDGSIGILQPTGSYHHYTMSNVQSKTITGIFVDDTTTVRARINAHNSIAWAVGKLQLGVTEKVNTAYNLEPPLKADEMTAQYFPSGEFH